MGRLFFITLEGQIYSCRHCGTHLGIADDIISKDFRCRRGRAYLFDKVVNVTSGEKEERLMTTGLHTVVDIFCVECGSIVGWKYEVAFQKNQKYKEGKFILERDQIISPNGNIYPIIQVPHHLGGPIMQVPHHLGAMDPARIAHHLIFMLMQAEAEE